MTAADRQRRPPPLLQDGFRPFFLGGAVFAAVAVPLWIAALGGQVGVPGTRVGLAWHAHEMLFGYVAAIVTGFLLTAIPNWTGRLPIAGTPLALLFALWLAGRLAVAFGEWIGPVLAALVDSAFLAAVTLLAAREVAAGRNWRNLPICGMVALLAVANVLYWVDAASIGGAALATRFAIAVAAVLIALVGGRIVPSFTGNWLGKRGKPRPPKVGRIDRLALLTLAAAMAAWTAVPESAATGGLALVAGALNVLRLARWRGWTTLAEPLVSVLHVGYFWLALALLLLAAANFGWLMAGTTAPLHAFTAGAVGTMTLAVMTRASLGHTGRALTAGPATLAIYTLVTVGAALRVAAPALPLDYGSALALSGGLWSAAFALFAMVYGPMLAKRRSGAD